MTSNKIVHDRKRYALTHRSTFEYSIPDFLTDNDILKIREKFIGKGLAGNLINKPVEIWSDQIPRNESIVSAMYRLTKSSVFQQYYDELIKKNDFINQYYFTFILISAICYKVGVPYIKPLLFTKSGIQITNELIKDTDDYIKETQSGFVKIRSSYIADAVLKLADVKKAIVDVIISMAISLSGDVSEKGRNYSKTSYEYITKYKYLRKILNLNDEEIIRLYGAISQYYSDISYYWLQVGQVEQHQKAFDYALQHFKSALAINKNSYAIQHAIARNYCKQASYVDSAVQAKTLFEEGKAQFYTLIDNREHMQSKSYAIHSLVYESMAFYSRNNMKMEEEEIKEYQHLINTASKIDGQDYVMTELQQKFLLFVNNNGGITSKEYEEYELNLDD